MKLTLNHVMMTVFLMLLVGSSLQIKNLKSKKDDSVDSPVPSHGDQALEKHDEVHVSNNGPHEAENTHLNSDEHHSEASRVETHGQSHDQSHGQSASSTDAHQRASLYDKVTQWTSYEYVLGLGFYPYINILDEQNLMCDDGSALNAFQYEERVDPTKWNNRQIRYTYKCVRSPSITNHCKNIEGDYVKTGAFVDVTIDTLGKMLASCAKDEVLKGFRYEKNPKSSFNWFVYSLSKAVWPEIRYKYTCCKARVSRVERIENEPTFNADNKMVNLKDQFVGAADFNALNSFGMLTPNYKIAYYYKASVLEGETSPSLNANCNGTPSFLGKIENNKIINFLETGSRNSNESKTKENFSRQILYNRGK